MDAEAFERWERLTLQKELDQMAVRDPLALESPVLDLHVVIDRM